MANDRDCENCKHHKEVCKNGIFYHSCESWDCEFEPKNLMLGYESPITKIVKDIETQMRETGDNELICEVRQVVGYEVDKTELLKALEYDRDQYNKGFRDGQRVSIEPKLGTWIPVSERLPERNVEVLVTTEWDCITIGEMISSNDWFIHEGATNADTDEIKAWMPLPEPYKAEGSEE